MNRTIKRVAMRYSAGACLALVVSLATVACDSKSENVKPLLESQSDSLKHFADDDPPFKPGGPGGGG